MPDVDVEKYRVDVLLLSVIFVPERFHAVVVIVQVPDPILSVRVPAPVAVKVAVVWLKPLASKVPDVKMVALVGMLRASARITVAPPVAIVMA